MKTNNFLFFSKIFLKDKKKDDSVGKYALLFKWL
jgi:hypothetical protein